MTAEIYRTTAQEVELLTRAKGGDGRTVFGRAVPYNVDQYINAKMVERFAPGVFRHQLNAFHRVVFTRDHMDHGGTLIGKTVSLEERDDGLYGSWRVSATPAGEETLELLRDGVLNELSIGFSKAPGGTRTDRGITIHTRANLVEVSVVLQGAYGDEATVSEVRSSEPDFPNLATARQIIGGLPTLPSF